MYFSYSIIGKLQLFKFNPVISQKTSQGVLYNELLFTLIQKTGLRISEALGLKVSDIRVVDGMAQSVRLIGKVNKERQVPLPEGFMRELALFIADKSRDEYLFAKKPGGKPIGQHAVRAYLKKMIDKAGTRCSSFQL
nr:site-specific integrase [Bathymodiolus japonicus methanotrophic gill symbiont]